MQNYLMKSFKLILMVLYKKKGVRLNAHLDILIQ